MGLIYLIWSLALSYIGRGKAANKLTEIVKLSYDICLRCNTQV
jgi:hypothetical protein